MSCTLVLALSLHVGLTKDYNQVHPGIDCGSFGAYYNSDRKISLFVSHDLTDHIEVGLVTGYDYPIIPMVRFHYGNLFITPAYETSTQSLGLVVGTEVRF